MTDYVIAAVFVSSFLVLLLLGQKPGFFTVATNLRGSRSQLEKRIRCIRGKQTKNRWVLASVLIVALAVSGCGMAVSAQSDNAVKKSGENFLDDISFQVPKGLMLENYDAVLGDYGGCLLTPYAYEGDFAPDEWKAAGYVMRFSTQTGEGSLGVSWKEEQISDVTIQWNHTEVKKLGKISGLAASAYLIKTEHDLYTAAEWSELEHTENAEPVSSYWCIVMARPEDAYGYVFALNAKNYTKEDAIAFAKTVRYVK